MKALLLFLLICVGCGSDEKIVVPSPAAKVADSYIVKGHAYIKLTPSFSTITWRRHWSRIPTQATVTEGSKVRIYAKLYHILSWNDAPALELPFPVEVPLVFGAGTSESSDYSAPGTITIRDHAAKGWIDIYAEEDADTDDETFTVSLGTMPDLTDKFCYEQGTGGPCVPRTDGPWPKKGSPHTVTITIDDNDDSDDGDAVENAPPTGEQGPTGSVGSAVLTGLTVASVADEPTQLAVSWDEVDSAAKYSVRWKTGSDDYGAAEETTNNNYTVTGLSASTTYTVNVAALDGSNTLLAESVGSGTTAARTSRAESPTVDSAPAVSFVIYHDPDAGTAAVNRYNQAVALLNEAGIAYSVVSGDVQAEASRLAGVTNSVMPRFFLGDPTAADWVSETKVNNGGLRWFKQKVAELSDD